ncbi:MAG: hypothetical protein GXP31_16615 [Kiritimatiellaeota bacterium]|nr:hypothetical protein [Kiritimatiellota bacterium]
MHTCGWSGLGIAVLMAGATAHGAEQTWSLAQQIEKRYETHRTFTAADLAVGRTPGFQVHTTVEAGARVLSIAGDETRILSGYIYVGRRIRLPETVPVAASVRLEYRRECSENNRAPGLTFCVFTPKGWDALSAAPEKARPPARRGRDALLFTQQIVGGREDTLEWAKWESRDLAPVLRRRAGREVVVALRMGAMHTGAVEWAQFRAPRLVLSDAMRVREVRKPRYPPKDRRTLLTDKQVELARARCEKADSAKAIRDRIVRSGKYWMALGDDELRARIPPGAVPRAFNVSTQGCPVHGKAIYKHGTYPWKLDIDKPFKIMCPVGGEEYPDNDFFAYLRSGFRDTALLKGKYVDDGWGWKRSNGEIYWLVGYACHWHWNRFILPGVLRLSRAYLLTGDPEYAHKCAVMLDRIADVYPGMEYENQSRYGFETGGRYRGKILNHIWETGTLRKLAEAYDNIFDALRDGGPLDGKLAKSSQATRENIEANILEEGIDCVKDGRIRGNFGMHQCALAMASVVREKGPVEADLAWILHESGGSSGEEGVEYAFYNYIYKDGMPFETSPGYCFSWVSNFVALARILEKAGYDFYAQPRFKAMFEAFLDLVCIGKYTPSIGDAGSLTSGRIGGSVPVYLAAFAHYREPRFAHALKELGAFRKRGFKGYENLFEPDVLAAAEKAAAETPAPALRSRVLDGYGLGILNNVRNTTAVSIYYGFKGGHGHFDRLNFSLFAYGRKMTPDLGYPDFMNALVPGIYSWSKNTINHNCVVVNRQRQTGNVPGRIRGFMDAPGVHFIDVSADGTYPEAGTYRRALVLVDLGADSGYLLDFFAVAGGDQHDYSLHGPLGKFRFEGGELSPPRKGTLAGENVAYGQFYDDPALAAPGYQGSYAGYKGSGFQHLEKVQTLLSGDKWWARWALEDAGGVGLRIRILGQPGQKLFVCDGRVSPTGKNPWVLKYLIARRKGTKLRSRYVTVLEPFKDRPQIADAERFDLERGVAVRVRRLEGEDIIVRQSKPGPVSAAGLGTDARLCVARLGPGGAPVSLSMLDGSYARIGGRSIRGRRSLEGEIVGVDYEKRAVRLRVTGNVPVPAESALRGRPILFSNARHTCMYTVGDVEHEDGHVRMTLDGPEFVTGRARVSSVDREARQIKTSSRFAFPAIYPGMRVVNEARTVSLRVRSVSAGAIQLEDRPDPADFTDADGNGVTDAWLVDFGPGDTFRIQSMTVWAAE